MSLDLELARLREEHRALAALLTKRALTETEGARLIELRKRLDEIHTASAVKSDLDGVAKDAQTFLGTVDRAMHAGQTPSERVGRIR